MGLPGVPLCLEAAAAKVASFVSDSVWPHRRQPTRLPRPWDSPGKNTGVGCHFLLQCMKVKSESEVAQSFCIFGRNTIGCILCLSQSSGSGGTPWFFVCLFVSGMWDLSSSTSNQTQTPCVGSSESWPLDGQGSPRRHTVFFCPTANKHGFHHFVKMVFARFFQLWSYFYNINLMTD